MLLLGIARSGQIRTALSLVVPFALVANTLRFNTVTDTLAQEYFRTHARTY